MKKPMGMSGDDTKFKGPEEFNPATLVLFIVESERTDDGAWQLARYCQEHKAEIVKWLSRDPGEGGQDLARGDPGGHPLVGRGEREARRQRDGLHRGVPVPLRAPVNCQRCNRDITKQRVWMHKKPWSPVYYCVPCHNRIMRARERRLLKKGIAGGSPKPL